MKTKKSYAVITGASSGIGRAFALRLAKEGYSLILIARRQSRLLQVKAKVDPLMAPSNICLTYAMDVTDEHKCHELMHLLQDQQVGIFINNAGFGDCSYFPEGSTDKELEMIDVNVKAMHLLTKLMIRKFIRQRYGYLLNVASSAGLMPCGPYMATYYASKAYVVSLTRAIARELKEKNSRVYIGCLCPGPVDTEFNQIANVQFALPGITAGRCVDEAIAAMKKRRVIIIPTPLMKCSVLLSRLLPSVLTIPVISHQQKKKF